MLLLACFQLWMMMMMLWSLLKVSVTKTWDLKTAGNWQQWFWIWQFTAWPPSTYMVISHQPYPYMIISHQLHPYMIVLYQPYPSTVISHKPYLSTVISHQPYPYMIVSHQPYPCMMLGSSIGRARDSWWGGPGFDSRGGRPLPTGWVGVSIMWPAETEVMVSQLCIMCGST